MYRVYYVIGMHKYYWHTNHWVSGSKFAEKISRAVTDYVAEKEHGLCERVTA